MKKLELTKEVQGVIAVVGLLAIALFAFAFRGAVAPIPEEEVVVDEKLLEFRHPLSGVPIEEEMELPRVFGVMVENHEDAWPQIGLDQAALVIEAPVEGRLPRMIAFFTEEQELEQVGPIRSARPYYIDWNAELDAVYAHVGGSPASLEILRLDDTIDINEFSNEWFFWRNKSRFAPHNVYSSMELLQEGLERFVNRFGETDNEWDSWKFKDHATTSTSVASGSSDRTVDSFSIDFAGEPYVINWEFDEEEGNYIRHQYKGRLHEMENGALIKADNIAIMETDIKILDSIGRRDLRTIGEGDALVFQDGIMIEATWKKASRSKRTRFYDRSTDEEIAMNAGVTWIEVIGDLEGDVEIASPPASGGE